MSRINAWVRRSLWDVVPRDHREAPADLRRRQWITAGVALVGAAVLGVSLRIEPGSPWFYPATVALAAVWVVGAFCSGPLHLGRIRLGSGLVRPVVSPVLVGLARTRIDLPAGPTGSRRRPRSRPPGSSRRAARRRSYRRSW